MLPDLSLSPAFRIRGGGGPVVAAALHAGHAVRAEVARALALSSRERRLEEDPFTDGWTRVGDWRIVALRSRFEVDLNRPREKAVYLRPEDAWGLRVWNGEPERRMIRRSLQTYDAFYEAAAEIFRGLEREHGKFLVLDLHSYNHRREGPGAPPADPAGNPEINIGTGSMDRRRWAGERIRFMEALRSVDFDGRSLDVRENVRFRGGHFPAWVHHHFPDSGCVFAVEVKKFFMDEWTGRLDLAAFERIGAALGLGASALREAWQTTT
jgi:N-formylglutamate deformylase